MKTEFENVKVVAKANVYYDGKVLSHTFFMPDGSRKTLGILFPGEYEFGTGDAEVMEPIAGELTVMLPGSGKWVAYGPGTSFNIPGNSKFKCKCGELSEYVCSYIKE
jgi:uncharacterized protein YaiE (UPF0345 family)